MNDLSIVFPKGATDAFELALVELSKRLAEHLGTSPSGGLGGAYGYGEDFENEVFLMHRFCWCEEQECAWCGWCLVDRPDPAHDAECYQLRVRADLLAEGFVERLFGGFERPDGMSWDEAQVIEGRVYRRWCEHFGLTYPQGFVVHCTCGASDRWWAEREACDCDCCGSRGVWGEKGAVKGRGAPNFWHKPSGLKVWWYKYIGRGMEYEGVPDVAAVADAMRSL